jgi:glutamate synthase (NADPH/NADH) small chain
MGDPKGFLKFRREAGLYRPVCERVSDYREVSLPREDARSREQASRCMDCGTPFCHWGCPIGNYIPEWNDLVYRGMWERAYELLQATNNLPEVTGRICPAPCEYACVLGINDEAVTIREDELAVIESAFRKKLVRPMAPGRRTGKSVAVVGSGPSGLAAADQLNKAGHEVTVFERDDKPGGIMRYGIPDFKLQKSVLDRRIAVLRKSGIRFETGTDVGTDIGKEELLKKFDAVCLATGSRVPRDLKIEGRELSGIHFAMDYLIQSNARTAGRPVPAAGLIDAGSKKVIVIGGGDTGADCVGTAHRQGAACVVQIEVLPRPPESRPAGMPWPKYPTLLKTSTSHEEGGERRWAVLTKRFNGEDGRVRSLSCARCEMSGPDRNGPPDFREVPSSAFDIEADLVILAAGFVHPEHKGIVKDLGLELDGRGNIKTGATYMTSRKGVFSAGDARRGQSLIVWAIAEGRRAAHNIDRYLMGSSRLPEM